MKKITTTIRKIGRAMYDISDWAFFESLMSNPFENFLYTGICNTAYLTFRWTEQLIGLDDQIPSTETLNFFDEL